MLNTFLNISVSTAASQIGSPRRGRLFLVLVTFLFTCQKVKLVKNLGMNNLLSQSLVLGQKIKIYLVYLDLIKLMLCHLLVVRHVIEINTIH